MYKRNYGDMDFSKIIENTILSIFLLFGKAFRTAYDFTVSPHVFAQKTVNRDPLKSDFPKEYARPLTYFFFLLVITCLGFYLQTKTDSNIHESITSNPFLTLLIDGLKNGDFIRIFFSISPYVMAVALFSSTLSWVAKSRYPGLNFQRSFYLASYFVGTASLCLIFLLPLTPLLTAYKDVIFIKVFSVILAIAGWSFLLRTLYSYFVSLRMLVGATRIRSMFLFIKGFLLFLIVYYAILLWLSPLFVKLIAATDN